MRGDREALSAMGKKGAEVRSAHIDEAHAFEDIEAERRAEQSIPRDILDEHGTVIPNPEFYEQVDEEN